MAESIMNPKNETSPDQWQVETLNKLAKAQNYLKWQVSFLAPFIGKNILELGSGTGLITGYILTDYRNVSVVDKSKNALKILKSNNSESSNLKVFCDDLEGSEFWNNIDGPIDTIIAVNLLEHVEDDIGLIKSATEFLEPGGKILLIVPAGSWLYGSADRISGHYRRYSKKTISCLFQTCGLEPEKLSYFNLAGTIGWWIRFVLQQKENFSATDITTINFLTPFLRRFENMVKLLVPLPFGLSLFAAATKKS